jgi:hypothetical protein
LPNRVATKFPPSLLSSAQPPLLQSFKKPRINLIERINLSSIDIENSNNLVIIDIIPIHPTTKLKTKTNLAPLFLPHVKAWTKTSLLFRPSLLQSIKLNHVFRVSTP